MESGPIASRERQDEMTGKALVIRRVVAAVFILYILVVVFLLVLPNGYRGHNVLVGGLTWERWSGYVRREFNLVPLHSLSQQVNSILSGQSGARGIIYLVGNLVGFVPLGYFLPRLFVRQRRFLTFLVTALLAIAFLELVQVFSMNGSFDVDDIILNAIGASVGYWMVRKTFAKQKRDFREEAPRG